PLGGLGFVFAHDDAAHPRGQLLSGDECLDHFRLEDLSRISHVGAKRLQLEHDVLLGLAHPFCNVDDSNFRCRHSVSLAYRPYSTCASSGFSSPGCASSATASPSSPSASSPTSPLSSTSSCCRASSMILPAASSSIPSMARRSSTDAFTSESRSS